VKEEGGVTVAVPDQPRSAKLEKKQDQYIRELHDIQQYIENDGFFLEGGSTTTSQLLKMRTNILLGKSLEPLVEMPGHEESRYSNLSIPRDLLGGRSRNLFASQQHLNVVNEHTSEERTNASDIVAVLSPRRRNNDNDEESNSEALLPPSTSNSALTS
jgi:hypothetical protein